MPSHDTDAAFAEKGQSDYGVPKNHGWETAKRVLHGLVILFSIIGIALAAALLAKTAPITVQSYNEDSGLFETIISACAIPILGLAAIWSIAELVTQLCKKWQSGIHPGAHVGVFLILSLGGIICTGLLGAWYTQDNTHYNYEYCLQDAFDSAGNPRNEGHCPSESELSTQKGLVHATLAFMGIVGVLCFVLFIDACAATDKRNKAKSAAKSLKHSHIAK